MRERLTRAFGSAARWTNDHPAAIGAIVFAVSFVVLVLATGDAPVHPDTARDLLMARECTVADACFTSGPITSFAGLLNGALWIHWLAAMRVVGLTVGAMHLALAGAHAFAATIVFLAATRLTKTRAPIAAWAIYLCVSFIGIEAPVLWNPAILPLPLVLLHLAAALGARSGDTRFAVATGLAVGLADSHAATLVLVPALFVITLATARKPALGALAFVSAWMIATLTLSAEMFFAYVQRARGRPIVAAGVLVLCAAGVLLRAPLRRRTSEQRAVLALGSLVVWFTAVLCLGRLVTRHPLELRYFHTVTPALAWLGGWLAADAGATRFRTLATTPRSRGAIVVLAATFYIARHAVHSPDTWSLRDVEILANHFDRRGLGFAAIARRSRGPDTFAVLSSIGCFDRHPAVASEEDSAPEMLVLHVPASWIPGNHPREWTLVPLTHDAVALVREQASFIDPRHIETCVRGFSRGGAASESCASGDLDSWVDPALVNAPLVRFDPAITPAAREMRESRATHSDSFEWRVVFSSRIGTSGPAHRFVNVDPIVPWELAVLRGSAPAIRSGSIVVPSGNEPVSIAFFRRLDAQTRVRFHGWLPDIVEFRDDEIELARVIARLAGGSR